MLRLLLLLCFFHILVSSENQPQLQSSYMTAQSFSDPSMPAGGSCVIQDGHIVVNGQPGRKLAAEDAKALENYNTQVQSYFMKMFGSSSEPMQYPRFPQICKESEISKAAQYSYQSFQGGCSIQNEKLYMNNKFIRNLTSEEQGQLIKFRQDMASFQMALQDSIRQQMMAAFTGQLSSIMQPTAPSPPNLCSHMNTIQGPK